MSDRYKGAILSPTAPTVTPQSAGGIYTSSQQLQYQGQGVWPSAFNNPINNSLRFRSSASAYLNRTPASASNQKTWTWSGWVKRGSINASFQRLFSAKDSSNDDADCLRFNSGETFSFLFRTTPNLSFTGNLTTTQVFRDPSAWYHIVAVLDTTQATSSNRMKLYVNGTQITSFSTATYPTQNDDGYVNSTNLHTIGNNAASLAQNFDGYLTEVNFIDGTALTPSSFGTTDAYGIWQPIPYTGAYGTNGFYLPFNPGATLSASYLVVAGGGGGGAGGAGAGGLLTGVTTLASAASYTVTVGAGGTSGNLTTTGGNGGNSVFDAITATGGGGGAGGGGATAGASGGSGGGGTNTGAGGAGTSGQGFAGGAGYTDFASYGLGGGGGGAGAVGGSAASGAAGGNGGVGIPSSISGTATFYAGGGGGGGGGGGTYPAGTGGNGGGGNGNSNGSGSNATANTGGGGGGAGSTGSGGLGGSGIVIVSYPGSARFTGGTITTSGGNTIHTFTSSGTLAGTSTAITNDYSGNGNNWTPNNISLTSGSTYDSMKDVPTNTNSNTANYCVMNPLVISTIGGTKSNGNLLVTSNSSTYAYYAMPTMFVSSGKWYAEVVMQSGTGCIIGIVPQNPPFSGNYIGGAAGCGTGLYETGSMFNFDNAGSIQTGLSTFTTGTVVGVALDMDNDIMNIYLNGTILATGRPNNNCVTYSLKAVSSNWSIAFGNNATYTTSINYGQQPFSYTPPTGFNRLNTYNLPTPTILAGNKYFDAVTYTGAGAGTVITSGFYPDFAWMKNRTAAFSNFVQDSVRGGGVFLLTDTTDADSAVSPSSTFSSTGITINANSSYASNSSYNYVLWAWNANSGSTVSNTQGTITSTVSANTTAGFSIVKINASGTSGSIGHGLGVAPSMIIGKNTASADDWYTYHASIGTGAIIRLNTSGAQASSASAYTNINSSTFTAGSGVLSNNAHVFYCFAQVAGYSAFGSYTGNGSTDGPFIFTGFRPRFVMFKSTGIENWIIHDTARDTYNVSGSTLIPNLSDSEYSNNQNMDILSNGVKMRSTNDATNTSGVTYTYMAFAENPFKISRAR